jgi:hypothetical protein
MPLSPDPITITLQGQSFVIRPLTLRQVRDNEVFSAQTIQSNVEHIAGILDILLKRDHAAELPEGGVLDMEITRDEIGAAAEAITRLTGGEKKTEQAAPPVATQRVRTGATATAA